MHIFDPRIHRAAYVSKENRLEVDSVSTSVALHIAELGNTYNINTGEFTLTGTGNRAVFFLRNQEDHPIIIPLVAIGTGGAGTHTDVPTVTIVRNPTGASFNTAVAINSSNRNFSSTNELEDGTVAYVGGDGESLTGGTDSFLFNVPAGGRPITPTNIILGKGNTLGILIDPKLSSGNFVCYAAMPIHVRADVS